MTIGPEFATIRYEVADGLARLTLNRPERMNGMTNTMVREAYHALTMAAADSSIRVLVLTGEGRAFCPGADLKHFTGDGGHGGGHGGGRRGPDEKLTARDFRAATLFHDLPAVTVAAVNGACAGAGLGWALACDLRIASASAKFNTAFLDVAVAGDMGGPWTLSRLVGASKARELYFLPGKFAASEAHELGLLAGVFADEHFRKETEALLERLLAASPTALTTMKANFLAAERLSFADYVDLESERHLQVSASEDTAEAFRAFVEKRAPQFSPKGGR